MTQVERYLALQWTWDIQYSAEDKYWVATIKELPDFFAAGENAGIAAFNAREALQSHLKGYLASGTPIPTPKPVAMTAQSAAAAQPAAA